MSAAGVFPLGGVLSGQKVSAGISVGQHPQFIAAQIGVTLGLSTGRTSTRQSSNSYNMATRALADLSPEGDKLAKCPRGHVITSLLQFERTSA